MDVDLLRPGTVPISPDTILWFEFLLNPSLLEKHLSKSCPDPSPTDLIIKFMGINSDQRENEVKILDAEMGEAKQNILRKWSFKSIALKILSLKVAAYLKWDLDILEKKLPLPMQLTLLQDLFFITGDLIVEIPALPDFSISSISSQLLFAVVLYHRWHIRAIVYRALNNKQNKQQFIHILGTQESTYVPPGLADDIIRKLEAHIPNSLNVLNTILESNDLKPKIPSINTFQMLTEDTMEIKQNWDDMYSISLEEFKCQIHYDLASFHFLREEYKLTRHHVFQAKALFDQLGPTESLLFCRVQKNYLDGYCLATEVPIEDYKQSLTQQLHASIKDQYTNILEILQMDNISREIPQVYRDNLELDIQGGLVNRKIIVARDLLLRIQCLNLLRKILDGSVIHGNYINEIKNSGDKGLDVLFWAIDHVLDKCEETEWRRIARYLHYMVLMGDMDELARRILTNQNYKNLFNHEEILEIEKQSKTDDIELPSLLLNDDWGVSLVTYTRKLPIEIYEPIFTRFHLQAVLVPRACMVLEICDLYRNDVKSPKFKVYELERRLILSYDAREIRELLILLDGSNPMNPLWRVNSRWELPIPLQGAVMSLPRGFRQDYSYVLLAKSRELVMSKDFHGAKELLNALEQEIQQQPLGPANVTYKLGKLLGWESILVDIYRHLNSWPDNSGGDGKALIEQCKQCLASLQSADQVIPRQEIIEYCTVFLLNMSEWDYLTSLEKRWSHCEFAAAISLVCQDIVRNKGSRKFPREAWDLVLTIFAPNRDQPQKRGSSGNPSGSAARDAIVSATGMLSRLREPTVLTVAISLLARLHNVLRDETSLELYVQYLSLWPAGVPNSNSYNLKTISETLFQLLTQALKYYPTNIPWLRVMGDLNFVLGFYESAMKYYLEAIMIASDLFSQPVPRSHIDDHVYRRMIKSCAHLQCYTQAAVLCQFLEEVDYSLAFKMAASDQKSSTSADAMDAYYHCIWDTTILEYLINLHTKRGEHHRKHLAIRVIGLLELNSNNNEEIQREAANTRKAKFFRALAKQYVY